MRGAGVLLRCKVDETAIHKAFMPDKDGTPHICTRPGHFGKMADGILHLPPHAFGRMSLG